MVINCIAAGLGASVLLLSEACEFPTITVDDGNSITFNAGQFFWSVHFGLTNAPATANQYKNGMLGNSAKSS